jgi:hypothetical protein
MTDDDKTISIPDTYTPGDEAESVPPMVAFGGDADDVPHGAHQVALDEHGNPVWGWFG